MTTIYATRDHEIACGHTVHGHESKCAHLHGHNYLFRLSCEAERSLDEIGRVIDFSVIKWTLCQWLEDNWDHRFLIFAGDPRRDALVEADPSVVVLPFNPTAENLAAYVGTHLGPLLLPPEINLTSVTVWETRKCSATWSSR